MLNNDVATSTPRIVQRADGYLALQSAGSARRHTHAGLSHRVSAARATRAWSLPYAGIVATDDAGHAARRHPQRRRHSPPAGPRHRASRRASASRRQPVTTPIFHRRMADAHDGGRGRVRALSARRRLCLRLARHAPHASRRGWRMRSRRAPLCARLSPGAGASLPRRAGGCLGRVLVADHRSSISRPQQIVVAGDSAGGGLTLALLLALRDAGVPLPAGAVGLSPWLDLTLSGATLTANAPTDYLNADVLRASAQMYGGAHDLREPLLSPLYAELAGLPPLLLQAGGAEMLLDDSRRFAAARTGRRRRGAACDLPAHGARLALHLAARSPGAPGAGGDWGVCARTGGGVTWWKVKSERQRRQNLRNPRPESADSAPMFKPRPAGPGVRQSIRGSARSC
jgi:hypothetical protein